MRRFIHLTHKSKSSLDQVAAFSLDAEKAFDRVEWGFLMAALLRFGIGPGFCRWVKTIYSSPRAAVLTNGLVSDFFHLSRGTRQGCSLSPLLSTIFLEPLALAIRANTDIKGVHAGGTEHKLFLYADDILAVLTDPTQSLPALLTCVESYSKLSGYKINWYKSDGMPLSTTCHSRYITAFNFKCLPLGMKYLGILLNPNLEDIMLSNMEPLLLKIKTNLDKWGKLNLTLWGKINVIKMVVAPQFNYVSMMLPVRISLHIFSQYEKIIRQFLWNKKKPRVNIKKMWAPRDIGGMALPNVKLYNLAFEMSRLVKHWSGSDSELSWIKIEQELVSPFTPLDVLSQGSANSAQDFHHNLLIYKVLMYSKAVWAEVQKICGASHLRQPYSSIWNNSTARIGKKTVYWNEWLVKGIHRISDLYSEGGFMSFVEITQKYGLIRKTNFWKYLQIRDCITKGKFTQNTNTVVEFLELSGSEHRAAVFYKLFNN